MTTGKMAPTQPLSAPAIASLLKQGNKPIFLLGAGASYRSGIPLAGPLVDQIAKWGYCKAENRHFDDPTIMRSDWYRWLERHSWYRADVSPADLYPMAVERILRPRENRREFFRDILRPGVPASTGYWSLARLMARRAVRTILTTNFDQLIASTARMVPEVYQISEIRTPDDQRLFSINPPYPQVIYLHGSVDHYTDQNIETETQTLDARLVELLRPVLRDHPLVVVGYRGWEPSVMRHLLIDQAQACAFYPQGIYWCELPGVGNQAKTPLLSELEAISQGNLQFVEIDGFDELMGVLEKSLPEMPTPSSVDVGPARAISILTQTHDLKEAQIGLDGLNETLLAAKLIAYCEASRLGRPDLSNRDRLWQALAERSLAMKTDSDWRPTRGAQLLFAKGAGCQLPQARITAMLKGPSDWVSRVLDRTPRASEEEPTWIEESICIEGDLWAQLEQVSDLLARVNRPFRLKGPSSHDVYPYPPLALKELLTNLLAHREYDIDVAAQIVIDPAEIYFENPGGLVETVRTQLDEESIQAVVGASARRVKGYRNPVIADFFFSAGAMDKEGSGLPDVVQEAANNLNEVMFGPTSDNQLFVARIKCRPEALAVDASSGTARTNLGELRYSPNLLHITGWPEQVTKMGTIASYKEVSEAESQKAPPFAYLRGWLWTFASVTHPSMSPLRSLAVEEEVHVVPTEDLLCDPDASKSIPRLLNSALAKHLVKLGLRLKIEAGRIRAYFPSNEGEPREVTYRGRFKTATRTVAKPIVSRTTGKTVYWEHKAVALRFERFGDLWTLALLPSYIFTEDGDYKFIASDKIGPLTTKRASRDYNPTVLHDMVFWARVIAGGSETTFDVQVTPEAAEWPPQSIEVSAMIPTWVFQESVDASLVQAVENELSDSELQELQESIEEIVEEERATGSLEDAKAADC